MVQYLMSDISQYYPFITSTIHQYLPDTTKIYLFGSCAMGTNKPNSDIDILLDTGNPIDLTIISKINNDFEESDLPYRIDLVDSALTSSNFKKVTEKI